MKVYTKEEYKVFVKSKEPKSPIFKNCFLAFIVGGSICALGQLLFVMYRNFNLSLVDGKTAVTISLIFLSALLTTFGLYDKIAKHAGAGTLVPITGFANSMVSPAMEYRSEGIITGLGVKLFVVSGPVIIFGVCSSVFYGLIVYLIRFFN